MSDIVHIGGMAMTDGVLMQSDRAWARARADGSIEVGHFPVPVPGSRSARARRVPVVRVVAGIARVVRVAFARPSDRRILWLGLGIEAARVGGWLLFGWEMSMSSWMSILTTLLTIVALRLAMPASLWRYHGAEHKAVTAYETGVDPRDVPAVLGCSRIHDRCGTNVFVVAMVIIALLPSVPPVLNLPITFVVLAVSAELVSLALARPRWVVSRLVIGAGRLAQRGLTTLEPSASQQAVGCRALVACLAEHARLAQAPRPAQPQGPSAEDGVMAPARR